MCGNDVSIIANGENSAAGRGITPKISIDLLRCGIAVLTSGDHIWDQKEIVDYLPTEPRLLRPLNYEEGTPGNGSVVLETSKGKVGVINAQGRTFMNPPLENPFTRVEEEAKRLREEEGVQVIFVDFHAETTSESIAMGWHLDGKVSAVAGTHTHVVCVGRMLPCLVEMSTLLCGALKRVCLHVFLLLRGKCVFVESS